jgi:hypothetical protein
MGRPAFQMAELWISWALALGSYAVWFLGRIGQWRGLDEIFGMDMMATMRLTCGVAGDEIENRNTLY